MNEEKKDNKDRNRGLIGTLLFHGCLFILFIFMGLKYYEPKPEDGIVINFGYSETGLGNEADGAPISSSQPVTSESSTESDNNETGESPTLTQDVIDAPSLDTKTSSKPKNTNPEKENKPEEQKPQPEKRLSDALKLTQETGEGGGEGEAGGAGDQGDPTGDKDSPNRVGGGGGGGTGNYLLGNRLALDKPKPDYDCADEGRVVVKIYVDRQGKVTQAIAGERVPGGASSTTASSCLYNKAKAAAMRTTWQADSDAPTSQIGYIIYNFNKR